MTRTVKIILALLAVYGIAMTAVSWKTADTGNKLEAEVAALEEQKSEDKTRIDSLASELEVADAARSRSEKELEEALAKLSTETGDAGSLQEELDACREKFGYDPTIEWALSRAGLTIEEVERSLKDHPEVIGKEPVLGGTMYFNRTLMLTPTWVFGQFEDGHVLGWGLYEYEYDKGVFTWREIASILDGEIVIGK